MKTNMFRVKEKTDKRLVIEEDVLKNPLLLLLKRNRKPIIRGLLMLLFCLILVSVGIGFSLFRGSNDYDITYITGSDKIETNDPDIDEDDIEDELLGEIAREDGVVVLVKSFMTPEGGVVSYYADGFEEKYNPNLLTGENQIAEDEIKSSQEIKNIVKNVWENLKKNSKIRH